jgi:hypothetical protein
MGGTTTRKTRVGGGRGRGGEREREGAKGKGGEGDRDGEGNGERGEGGTHPLSSVTLLFETEVFIIRTYEFKLCCVRTAPSFPTPPPSLSDKCRSQ